MGTWKCKSFRGALPAYPRRRVELERFRKPLQYPSVTLSNSVTERKLSTEDIFGGYENVEQKVNEDDFLHVNNPPNFLISVEQSIIFTIILTCTQRIKKTNKKHEFFFHIS